MAIVIRDQPARARRVRIRRHRVHRGRAPGARRSSYRSLYALGHPLVGNPDLVPERGESHEIELSQALLDGARALERHLVRRRIPQRHRFRFGPAAHAGEPQSRGFARRGARGRLGVGEQWMLDASRHEREEPHRVDAAASCATGRSGARDSARIGRRARRCGSRRRRRTSGSSFDSSIATGDVRLPAYTRVDVSAVWQLSPRFETYLAIDNLTDEQYEQFVGFEARGIVPRLGVKFSL